VALFLHHVEAPELKQKNASVPDNSQVDFLDSNQREVVLENDESICPIFRLEETWDKHMHSREALTKEPGPNQLSIFNRMIHWLNQAVPCYRGWNYTQAIHSYRNKYQVLSWFSPLESKKMLIESSSL